MIRRIIGISHVADLEKVEDEEIRAECERRCLLLARETVFGSALPLPLPLPLPLSQVSLNDIHQLVGRARVHYALSHPLAWSGERRDETKYKIQYMISDASYCTVL